MTSESGPSVILKRLWPDGGTCFTDGHVSIPGTPPTSATCTADFLLPASFRRISIGHLDSDGGATPCRPINYNAPLRAGRSTAAAVAVASGAGVAPPVGFGAA
jgi:hypothetical protein